MATSKYFKIIDRSDGQYLVPTGSIPSLNILMEELLRMQIHIDPFVLAQKLKFNPRGEILISSPSNPNLEADLEKPFSLHISSDKMLATLTIYSTSQPPLSITDLHKELAKAGIVYGINKVALAEACQHPGIPFDVAVGFAAVDGHDAVIVMNYHEQEKKPVLLEDGRVNYYELGQIISVRAGDTIGVRTPATPGVTGYNVMGETLPARSGRDTAFPMGKGILASDTKAVAEYDGAVSWNKNRISIIKMFTVTGDVDFSVGNINFPGKILIMGNVTEGFKVMAEEDIDIRGAVENAEIASRNGSIFVQRGIIGRGKAVIKAHKNVEAKFIQEAVVDAGHNIIVNEYVIRCDMKAGNSVLIQGRKGRIMGINNITAKTKIKASQIQNSAGLHLKVEGIQRSHYYERVKELNKQISSIEKELSRLTSNIRQLEYKTSDPGSLVKLQKLLPEYLKYSDDLEACTQERNLLANVLKSTRGEGMIEIASGLEQGMRLTIKDESININDNISQLSMYFDPDEKRIKIASGKKQ
ncbi:MAG: FapA family protein [Syntrophomonas sp.]|nr:FapA family protein [Syntrophomonas sp.]